LIINATHLDAKRLAHRAAKAVASDQVVRAQCLLLARRLVDKRRCDAVICVSKCAQPATITQIDGRKRSHRVGENWVKYKLRTVREAFRTCWKSRRVALRRHGNAAKLVTIEAGHEHIVE
jgi:hypothetical protein